MRTDHVLTLTQWLSPAFPVGAFAYSHGLEWAIEAGQVTDRDTLAAWIDTTLRHGAGRTDALFLAAGFHASDPQPVDQLARAYAASAERLKETVLQGEAFCRAIADLSGRPMAMLTYPVAVGHAARQHALPLQLTAQMFLQAFVVNLAGVAMRLVPLGQTEGQRVICDLMPTCVDIADDAMGGALDDLASTAFLSDIASMKHETQYARIFRT